MASNALRIFRKWNRILHRDFGYFFFGVTIIYCLSGIALNHKKDWNPNYNISYKEFSIRDSINKSTVTEAWVISFLKKYKEDDHYKKYFFPDNNTLKIFIDNGSVSIDMNSKQGYIERISKRHGPWHDDYGHPTCQNRRPKICLPRFPPKTWSIK